MNQHRWPFDHDATGRQRCIRKIERDAHDRKAASYNELFAGVRRVYSLSSLKNEEAPVGGTGASSHSGVVGCRQDQHTAYWIDEELTGTPAGAVAKYD